MQKNGLPVLLTLFFIAVVIFLIGVFSPISDNLIQFPQPITKSKPIPSPTFNPTSNWKLYTNKKYKFSFKLAPNWEVKNVANKDNVLQVVPLDLEKDLEIPLTISINPNPNKLTENQWVDNLFSSSHPRDIVKAGTIEWTRAKSSLSTYQAILYFKAHNSYVYELYNSILVGEYSLQFNQMLTTFQFIN